MKKGGFDFFLPFFTRLPSRALFDRGRHRMVIRGHIKNGNGTNKYLTGSRDVRKKGFPIYLNTTYDLLSLKPKRKRKLFIPSLFFLQTIPSTAIYTEKMLSAPTIRTKKFYTFGMEKKKENICIFRVFSKGEYRKKNMVLDNPTAFHSITKSFESRRFSSSHRFDLLLVMVMMGSVFHFRM